MDWQVSMGFSFLVVISVIMWGASQGWYSKKLPPRPRTQLQAATSQDNCDELLKKIAQLEGMNFSLTNELNEKNATISDLNAQIQQLMNAINDISTRLQNAETENAQLRTSLKNALDDLARCRRELQECRAELMAKRIAHEKCKMLPETSNLLR